MKTNLLLSLVSIAALAAACGEHRSIEVTALQRDTVITKLSDSVFLSSEVYCLDYKDGATYVADATTGIYVLDTDFRIADKVGAIGHGRGEFLSCESFCVDDSQCLYVYNEGSFFVYQQGLLLSSLLPEGDVAFVPQTRFVVDDGRVYHAIRDRNYNVAMIDRDGACKKMCRLVDGVDDVRLLPHSERHIVKGDQSIWVVGVAFPVVQEFTLDGKLLASLDLRDVPELKKTFDDNRSTVPNSYYVAIRDAYYRNGCLYLLATSNANQNFLCNRIYAFSSDGQAYRHVATYQLRADIYHTFCVTDDNRCIAVNAMNSDIEVYGLPNCRKLKRL